MGTSDLGLPWHHRDQEDLSALSVKSGASCLGDTPFQENVGCGGSGGVT